MHLRHLVFTLKGCQFHLLDDEAHIRNLLVNAAVMAQATLLDVTSHKFDPQGVTAVALLCLLYTSPSPRDATLSRMPSSA